MLAHPTVTYVRILNVSGSTGATSADQATLFKTVNLADNAFLLC